MALFRTNAPSSAGGSLQYATYTHTHQNAYAITVSDGDLFSELSFTGSCESQAGFASVTVTGGTVISNTSTGTKLALIVQPTAATVVVSGSKQNTADFPGLAVVGVLK